jgi:hypothetical protein
VGSSSAISAHPWARNKQPNDYFTDKQGTSSLKQPEQSTKAPFIALIVPLEVKGEVTVHLGEGCGRVGLNIVSYELPSPEAKDPAASRQQDEDGEHSDEDEQKHRNPCKTPWTFPVECDTSEEGSGHRGDRQQGCGSAADTFQDSLLLSDTPQGFLEGESLCAIGHVKSSPDSIDPP